MISTKNTTILALSLAGLSACGGGSSSDNSTSVRPQEASFSTSNASALIQSGIQTLEGAALRSDTSESYFGDILETAILTFDNNASSSSSTTVTSSQNCQNNGTIASKTTDADSSGTLSAGDSIELTFNGCDNGFGFTRGSVTVEFSSFAGNTSLSQFATDIEFNKLEILDTINLRVTGQTSLRGVASGNFSSLTVSAISGKLSQAYFDSNVPSMKTEAVSVNVSAGQFSFTPQASDISINYLYEGNSIAKDDPNNVIQKFSLRMTDALEFDSSGNVTAGRFTLLSGVGSAFISIISPNVARVQLDSDGDGLFDKDIQASYRDLREGLISF